MQISLCIIKNWLEKYHPELRTSRICSEQNCKEDCLQIKSVRLFNNQDISLDRDTLYVGRMSDFYDSRKENVVCKYTESVLILDTCDIFSAFNEILSAFTFYDDWGNHMQSMIERECLLNELVDYATEILKNPVIVLDSSDSLIGYSSVYKDAHVDSTWDNLLNIGHTRVDDALEFHNEENKIFNPKDKEPFFLPEGLFPRPCYSQNLFFDGKWCGICSMSEFETGFNTGNLHLFKIFCDYLQLWIDGQNSGSMFRMDAILISKLVRGESKDFSQLQHKLSLQGWKDDDEKVLLTVAPKSSQFNTLLYVNRIISELSKYIYSVTFDDEIVIIANLDKMAKKTIFEYLKPWLLKANYLGGLSYSFRKLSMLPDAYHQACAALRFGINDNSNDLIYNVDKYAFNLLIDEMSSHVDKCMIHPAVLEITAYDKKHHTDYLMTLYEYLALNMNIKESAKKLEIHRNTLLQRVHRLKDYFDINFENVEERLFLVLSIRMHLTGKNPDRN